ncbi:MAG: hypothetical protein GC154_08795 [bacterium]|nr:hypothetical protein [bacterium]
MNKNNGQEHIVHMTLDEALDRIRRGEPTATDWARVDAMTEEDIDRAIAEDPDSAPAPEDAPSWIVDGRKGVRLEIHVKQASFLKLHSANADIEAVINQALEEYLAAHPIP